jgi:hypothetical protein
MPIARPPDVVCDKWEPTTLGSKACRYYLRPNTHYPDVDLEKSGPVPSGLCRLPSEMLCVEWVRRNGTPEQQSALRVPPLAVKLAPPPAPKRALLRTPFGGVDVALPEGFKPAKGIDPQGIEALERSGVEVELSAPYLGEKRRLAIVPSRTGRGDRDEITFREAATLRLIVDAFPGAHVVGYTAAAAAATAANASQNGPGLDPPLDLLGRPAARRVGGGWIDEAGVFLPEKPLLEYPLTGTRCSICGEPQHMTPGGESCIHGHGGAAPVDDIQDKPAPPAEDPLS